MLLAMASSLALLDGGEAPAAPAASDSAARSAAATAPTPGPAPTTTPATPTPSPTGPGSPAPPQAPRPAVRQLILVSARAYGETYATLIAYRVSAGRRRVVFGPWTARVGYNGFAPPGQKREGDGRTPSGRYGFQFMFGVKRDPRVHFRYRRVHRYDFWVDDPVSPLYNEWVDARTQNPGNAPEPMFQTPAYDYGAAIAYNTARTPGLGSAIFLHGDVGGPTGGCVSLPAGELLNVLRWLDPARSPLIEMGVGAVPR